MIDKFDKIRGFTITELLITTAIFSAVLLISIVGFLQIGQIFYKGVTATRTHDATRNTLDSLANDIRFATTISQATPQPTGLNATQYFCAGTHRYTFKLGSMVDPSTYNQANGNIGLIKDTLPVVNSCGPPYGSGSGVTPFNRPQELLGNRMRLGNLNITRLASPLDNMYSVSVKIAYGDNTALQNTGDSDPNNDTCDSSLKTSQYCHVSTLRTAVRQGIKSQ